MNRHLFLTGALASVPICMALAAQNPRDEGLSGKGQQEEMAGQTTRPCLHQASNLIGMNVCVTPVGESEEREEVGELEDVWIDSSTDELRFGLISVGGFLGIGEDRVAIPWGALKLQNCHLEGDDHEDEEPFFLVEASRKQLEGAPEIDDEQWPNLDGAWTRRVDAHFGTQAAANRATARLSALRLSELMDADVHGSEARGAANDGQESTSRPEGEAPVLGHIHEIALDCVDGRPNYAVLEADRIEDLVDERYVIPWEMFATRYQDDELVVSSPGLTSDKLSSAPVFDSGDWEAMSDPVWIREVYTFWQLHPYWSRPTEAGYDESKDRRDDGTKGGDDDQRRAGDGDDGKDG